MGLFSGLVKAGIKLATNIDNIADIVDKTPETIAKAKDTATKIKDIADSANENIAAKKLTKQELAKGIENEKMVTVSAEKLFKLEYSVPCKYKHIKSLENDYFLAKDNGKYGIIDVDNNIIIPFEYDSINGFGEGLFPVKKDGKYGFVDENNNVVIDFIFRDAGKFASGLAPVQKPTETTTDESGKLTEEYKSSWGYIDKSGSFIIKPMYASAEPFEDNGLARTEKSTPNMSIGDFGVIDTKHNTIINHNFNSIEIHKKYIECIDKNYDYCYCNLQGIPIEEPQATEIPEGIEKVYNCSSEKNSYMLINDRKIYLYHDSRKKHGWYESLENEILCRIKPIFDKEIRLCYTQDKKKYSIVQYGGLYGIIKFDESEV